MNTAQANGEAFLTTSEVARRLDLMPDSVRHLERKGVLPAQRTATGVRLFRASDVEALVIVRRSRVGAR